MTTNAEALTTPHHHKKYSRLQIMTPVEVRRSGTHLFHEVSVSQLITGSGGGPAQWKEVNDKIRFLLTYILLNK